MDWFASGVVLACLVVLAADASRRWGRPRAHFDFRSPLTWATMGVMVAAMLAINLVD